MRFDEETNESLPHQVKQVVPLTVKKEEKNSSPIELEQKELVSNQKCFFHQQEQSMDRMVYVV